jgi:hypothetical protein
MGTGGLGIGFTSSSGSDTQLGKVGEWSGLKPSYKPTSNPKLIKITTPKPITPKRDDVIEEPVRPLLRNKCKFQNLTTSRTY